MRVAELAGTAFAFELEWAFVDTADSPSVSKGGRRAADKLIHDQIVELATEAGRRIFYTVRNAHGRPLVGYGFEPVGEKFKAKSLQSYGDALASVNDDGIYVCPSDSEGMLWYVVIQDNAVVPGTDRCGPQDEIAQTVEALSSDLGVPVHAMTGLDLGFDSEPFDPEAVVQASATNPMNLAAPRGGAGMDLLVRGAFVVLALGGGIIWFSSSKESGKRAEEERAIAEQRTSYAAQVVQAVGTTAGGTRWLSAAVSQAYTAFPAHFKGWTLDGITCTPVQCIGRFKADVSGYDYLAIERRFSTSGGVRWNDREGRLMATLRLKGTGNPAALTDEMVLSGSGFPGGELANRIDVEGRYLLAFAETSVKDRTMVDLPVQYSAPPGVASLIHEGLTTQGAFYLSADEAARMGALMASSGFGAGELELQRRTNAAEPSWSIKWSRLKVGG